jgi:uncharacterized protein
MRQSIRIAIWYLFVLGSAFSIARGDGLGERIGLDPPGQREFILDKANLLDSATKAQIQQECDKLLTEHATPIIVVTIPSLAQYGGGGLRIETFARLLFDQWQVGVAKLGKEGQIWNTGILLLVSVGDRKARIELGAGWRRDNDQVCQQIMDEQIVPNFRRGDYAGGIAAGVKALDAMARGKPLPAVPRPWWHLPLVVGVIALGIFTIVSLVRRGSSGWAWVFWGAVFALIGYLLYTMLTRSVSSSGYGGGSFGGGYSGGGGATGSW